MTSSNWPRSTKITAQRTGRCARTGADIPAGEECWWIPEFGLFKERPTGAVVEEVREKTASRS